MAIVRDLLGRILTVISAGFFSLISCTVRSILHNNDVFTDCVYSINCNQCSRTCLYSVISKHNYVLMFRRKFVINMVLNYTCFETIPTSM